MAGQPPLSHTFGCIHELSHFLQEFPREEGADESACLLPRLQAIDASVLGEYSRKAGELQDTHVWLRVFACSWAMWNAPCGHKCLPVICSLALMEGSKKQLVRVFALAVLFCQFFSQVCPRTFGFHPTLCLSSTPWLALWRWENSYKVGVCFFQVGVQIRRQVS